MQVANRPSIASTLPAEVLACVFQYIQTPLPDTPTPPSSSRALRSITHVCRHWRFAALAYSCLWKDVSTRFDSPQWVTETLLRSGMAPLRVDLCWDTETATAPIPYYVHSLLSVVTRAERLSFFGPYLASRLQYIPPQPFENLTSLTLGALCGSPYDPMAFHSLLEHGMPQLHSLVTMGYQLPWSSTLWPTLSHTLVSLTILNVPQPLRPSPSELQAFLTTMHSLEDLTLGHILPIYPPHHLNHTSLKTVMPRLRNLSLSDDCYQNMSTFVNLLIREDATCKLSMHFAPQLPSLSALIMSIPYLATAARHFLHDNSPAKSSPVPQLYDMELRQSSSRGHMTFRLHALHLGATPKLLFSLDLSKGDISNLLTTTNNTVYWSWSDAGASAAALPFVLASALPIRTFSVECSAYESPHAWTWSFHFARISPSRIRVEGPAALGLVAALSCGECLYPSTSDSSTADNAYALFDLMQQDRGANVQPRPLLYAMTHLAICAVDFTARAADGSVMFAQALAETLSARQEKDGVVPLEHLVIIGCGATEAHIAMLKERLSGCVVEWDGVTRGPMNSES